MKKIMMFVLLIGFASPLFALNCPTGQKGAVSQQGSSNYLSDIANENMNN